ncbi:MAG: hypothetical protein KGN76_09975 [Acidobacteriota bacterium]|nr:hypothetical protein [Acidobacteriota bacterium]
MKVGQAIRDGLMGALVALAVLAIGGLLNTVRSGQMPVEWQVAYVIHHIGTYLVMLAVFLVAYGLAGLWYAAGFEKIVKDSGPAWGMLFALPHAVFFGFIMGFLPAFGLWPDLTSPGPGIIFMGAFFSGPFIWLFAHFAYGIMMGTLYKPAARPRIG